MAVTIMFDIAKTKLEEAAVAAASNKMPFLKPRRRFVHAIINWQESQRTLYVEQRGDKFYTVNEKGPDYPVKLSVSQVNQSVEDGTWLEYWSEPLPILED